MKKSFIVHPSSDVKSNTIGNGTIVWQFSVICKNAKIGRDCNINSHVFIENDVEIGSNVTIKSGVQIWDGIRVADEVFIGPNITFSNDDTPRSKKRPEKFQITVIEQGASIGANATLIPGISVGSYAMVAAGAVVTKNIPQQALVMGSPAKQVGWVCTCGRKLIELKCNICKKNFSNLENKC